MPGLKMFKKSFYSNIGANQTIVSGTINLGSSRGRVSSTRIYNFCKRHPSSSTFFLLKNFINVPVNYGNIEDEFPNGNVEDELLLGMANIVEDSFNSGSSVLQQIVGH